MKDGHSHLHVLHGLRRTKNFRQISLTGRVRELSLPGEKVHALSRAWMRVPVTMVFPVEEDPGHAPDEIEIR